MQSRSKAGFFINVLIVFNLNKRCVLISFILILCFAGFSQKSNILFIHTEYQALNYNFYSIGIGFQPKKQIFYINPRDVCYKGKFKFNGFTFSFNKKLENKDWGLATQLIGYCADFKNPIGAGIELNYKSIEHSDHFSVKPLIGLSLPLISFMYGYNFDFYKIKSLRVNQHELIMGIRIPVLKRNK